MHFTQEDLAQFEIYRTNLDRMTLTPRHAANSVRRARFSTVRRAAPAARRLVG